MAYTRHIVNPETPQSEKAKEVQVKNYAGGYIFQISDWDKLDRFLILGNEGGTYYATEKKLTVKNFNTIMKLLSDSGEKVVDRIVEISQQGRAPKNAPAVFALAVASVYGNREVRTYANKNMPKVCRYSTDLFSWVNSVKELKNGKMSKGLQRAIGRWYNEHDASFVAYQVCKYPGRKVDGQRWTHRDLLRIARPGPDRKTNSGMTDKALSFASPDHRNLFKYIVKGQEGFQHPDFVKIFGEQEDLKYVYGHELAKKATKSSEIVKLISKYNLTRESIPNTLYNANVWKALLPHMPIRALIRNLGQMTSAEVFKDLSDETSSVVDKITKEEILKKARIHPMNILLALKIYQSGGGIRSSWNPVDQISEALEDAFYASFNYVEPTGKKIMVAIDVSPSMTYDTCAGSEHIDPITAAGVMAMTIARTEKNHYLTAFCGHLVNLKITAKSSLDETIRVLNNRDDWARTDCAQPMLEAISKKMDVDAFIILTDNETWSGGVHPFEALKNYRKKFNSNAKLIVAAFTATGFSIADPEDAGMLDVVGLDSSTPQLISDFIAGRI